MNKTKELLELERRREERRLKNEEIEKTETKETEKTLTKNFDTVSAIFTDDYSAEVPRIINIENTNIFDGDLWYLMSKY